MIDSIFYWNVIVIEFKLEVNYDVKLRIGSKQYAGQIDNVRSSHIISKQFVIVGSQS
jgi:hypothetical protein